MVSGIKRILAKKAGVPARPFFVFLLLGLIAAGAFVVFLSVQKASALNAQQRVEWAGQKQRFEQLLAKKDQDLALAAKENFQEELMTVQEALKDANLRMTNAVREKSAAENASILLDSRLKNTTQELTRTLEELKNVRETLGGIEGQYKTKLAQVADTLKSKEAEFIKLQEKLKNKESSVEIHQAQLKTSVEDLRKNQLEIESLRKSVATLEKAVADKDKQLAQKQADLDRARLRGATIVKGSSSEPVPAGQIEGLEKERTNLERQVSDASARLFDQQESLKDLEKKVQSLTQNVAERDALLAQKGKEVDLYRSQVETLRQDIISLRNGSGQVSASMPLLSQTQRDLEERILKLEEDKAMLEARLASASSGKTSKTTVQDPFQDRNFRILTETLVKKEEQINAIQKELEILHREKRGWELGSGPREKRLMELEILVTTLTKQLGEYAALIEKKDTEVKDANRKMNALMDELEAQKLAATAMQKELAEARGRQEKTFQTLTQIMSMNAGPAIPASLNTSSYEADVYSEEPVQEEVSVPAVQDAASAKKRAEELRKRVEILLQKQEAGA